MSWKQNRNIFAYPQGWQYPAITEQYAYERVCQFFPDSLNVAYIGFPWATLIDLLHMSQHTKADFYLRILSNIPPINAKIKITVAQHIYSEKYSYLFELAGITDIFWSHATQDLPAIGTIRVHPFPLYPVRCLDSPETLESTGKPLDARKYLYSFVGAYDPNCYLTESRRWIADLPPTEDGLILNRSEWHYGSTVYGKQILGKVEECDKKHQNDNDARSYRKILEETVFSLCPSGSGPNSIRLWESLGFGCIPVIMANNLKLPGEIEEWLEAAIFISEDKHSIHAMPDQLRRLANDNEALNRYQQAARKLWNKYGYKNFIFDLLVFANNAVCDQTLEDTHFVEIDRNRTPSDMSLRKYPKISIVTPSFNQGDFIEKTITSVLSQNYPNLEYIIIDGGSTDQSVDIIRKYSGRLTYWCSEKDKGQSEAINKGLAMATGQVFNWLCSDDYLEPGALFKLAEAYQADPHAAGWVGGCRWVDNNYNVQWVFYPHSLDFQNFARNFNGKQLSQPSCFLNTGILKEIGGVDQSFTYAMDFNLWLRMLQRGVFKIGSGIWSNYYFHSEAKTVKNRELSYREACKVQRSFGFDAAATRRLEFYQAGEKDYWPLVVPDDLQKEFSLISTTVNTVGRFNTEPKKILFISTNVPAPENHAADKRICQILNILLANNYEIHFAYLTDNIKDRQFGRAFGDRINFYRVVNHDNFQNPDIFVQLVRELDPATVFITNCWWLQYCLLMTHVLIRAGQNNLKSRFVVDTMDFHYKHYMRKYNVSNDQQDLQEAENFLKVENEFYSRADCVVVVTEEEKNDVLNALNKPIKEIKSIPTIHEVIDTELHSLVPMENRASNICFVGNFGSQHNVEAVRFFLKEVFPRILKGFPQTGYPDPEFHVIGINLEPYRQEFASSHVKVVGFVEDLLPLLSGGTYKIMVCPLVFGSGIKGKIGDAAGVGLPFVTTSIGAEGFPVQDGVDCFIADDPVEFASKCIQLMTDNVIWHNFSIRSRIMVHNNYSLSAVSRKMKEIIEGSDVMIEDSPRTISNYERIQAMKEQAAQQAGGSAEFYGKFSQEQMVQLLRQIQALPSDWHKAGTLDVSVLAAIVKHTAHLLMEHTLETGSGKSTLLLSNISRHHLVFALDFGDSITCVKKSPLFNQANVEYVEGPTQSTLPYYRFVHKLDFALIDGPHGYPFPEIEYYFIYPHLKEGAILVVDDIHIPTIFNLFKFLMDDTMFEFLEIVNQTTAFFRRTSAPLFSPTGDGWWEQEYNKKNFPESMLNDDLRKLLGR